MPDKVLKMPDMPDTINKAYKMYNDWLINKERAWQTYKSRPAGTDWITCPVCHQGKFGGLFYHSCTNPGCILWNDFAMGHCRMCGRRRVECCC
jgi:hypothetical protein